jgi:hypothetical protein
MPDDLKSTDWLNFYDFIVVSYRSDAIDRLRVSELSDLLQDAGFPRPGTLAVTYAHSLYVLARSDGRRIYKGGFNP